jgi:hypothetical protein
MDLTIVLGDPELRASPEIRGHLGAVNDILAWETGDVRARASDVFRSITTALFPSLANVQARYLPASPLPSTTMSYFSGLEIWSFILIEVVRARMFESCCLLASNFAGG